MSFNIIDTVKVKYNFDGDNNTELTIRKDDIIDVIVIDPSGWADGIIRSKKKRGWFPMQYTRSISNQDNLKIQLPLEKNSKESPLNNNIINETSNTHETSKLINELSKRETLSNNWKKKRTINGKKYYINIETNETTYNKSRTLRRNEISQLSKELQNTNIDTNIKLELPSHPPPKKSEKIMNLANIISSSLSNSSYNLSSLSGENNESTKQNSNSNLNENESPNGTSRPTSSNITKSNSTVYGTPVNFYSNGFCADSDSSSLSNSRHDSVSSLNGTISSINGVNIATLAASLASHNPTNKSLDSLDINNHDFSLKKTSVSGSSNQLPSPQGTSLSSALVEKIKKLDISKNNVTKKNGAEKYHQRLIQLFTDFIQSINKNKKSTYLEQCNEIKNTIRKFFIVSNILNQEGGIVATTSSQINLYYSSMLSLSKMILNVRDAVGQWPPPDANQLIFQQIDEFIANYQLLLNTINFTTINNNENGSELSISSPITIINTNPTFLTTTVENCSTNAVLSKMNQQISIIMMSISDLIIVSRKDQTVNQNIYKLSIECRDNISILANDIDEIQFKKKKASKVISQFIHKKEILMNSIKELTITIKSSNEKFAPSNSLELILESLSNCINIIDDISIIIKGLYDAIDSPALSQQNSFDMIEMSQNQDSYEQNKKIFGEQNSVFSGAFSKKLEMMLKKKDSSEVKSAGEPSENNINININNKHIKSLNEKINYKGQFNSEMTLLKDQPPAAQTQKIYKVNSNPKVATPGRSKINKFFGEDDADIENEKLNNTTPKPWYLMTDYPKGSITYNMEGQINGATFSTFIEFVTSHENDDLDLDQKTLILMYDQFCTTPEFIDHLTKRYFIKPPKELTKENIQEWKVIKQTPIQNKVLKIIGLWLTDYFTKEEEEFLPNITKFLTDASNPISQSYSDSAIEILFKAKKMMSAEEPSKRNSNDSYPHPIIPKSPQEKITFLDIDPVEFTRQMCLLEGEAYSKVHPHELMIVNKKNCKSDSIKMMTKISIRITQYIIAVILSDMDAKKRNAYLRHAINICKKSFEERNFDLVFSVIAALNSSAIVRLSKTWSLLPTKFKDTLELCQNQISHNKNYQKYRHILKTCEKPCIPFFGIILKDITFTEDGNSKYRKENLINISKFRNLAMIVEEYNSFKVPYNFKEVPVLQFWLRTNVIDVDEKDEQDLYNISLKVEPREQPSSASE